MFLLSPINETVVVIAITIIVAIAIILIILHVLFLMSLQKCLKLISKENREMFPGLVWLNLIPLFNLGWQIYIVIKISASVEKEAKSRNMSELNNGACGIGLAMAICNIIAQRYVVFGNETHTLPLLFIFNIITPICVVSIISCAVFWIMYWIKIADINNRLKNMMKIKHICHG